MWGLTFGDHEAGLVEASPVLRTWRFAHSSTQITAHRTDRTRHSPERLSSFQGDMTYNVSPLSPRCFYLQYLARVRF